MASGSKCPARALATHFEPTATLTGFDRMSSVNSAAGHGNGACRAVSVVGSPAAAPPLPPRYARPMRNGLRAESGQALQVFGPVRTPPFSRASVTSRGTP